MAQPKGLLNIDNATAGDLNRSLGGLTANPLFGMGMNLMASKYNPKINPFTAAMSGLSNARQKQLAEKERERMAAYRKQMAELIRQQNMYPYGVAPQGTGMPQGTGTPLLSAGNHMPGAHPPMMGAMNNPSASTQNAIQQYTMQMLNGG